nr:immunoglobulin light chain junction region [Macaca mulatta]
CQHYYGPPLTF